MESKQIKRELCTIMSKVWTATGLRDECEPCDCICDKKGLDEDYIRVNEGVIEFIKEAVESKISDLESIAQATLDRIERMREEEESNG